jgi:hypothetical protein
MSRRVRFSPTVVVAEHSRSSGGFILQFRFQSKMRVSRRIASIRRTVKLDTQRLRRKTAKQLGEIFKIAAEYATGKIERVTGQDGKPRPLTVPERQFWAKIAAYSAQIINNILKGFDERQVDQDLENLARMLDEGKAAQEAERVKEAQAAAREGQKSDGSKSSTAR